MLKDCSRSCREETINAEKMLKANAINIIDILGAICIKLCASKHVMKSIQHKLKHIDATYEGHFFVLICVVFGFHLCDSSV